MLTQFLSVLNKIDEIQGADECARSCSPRAEHKQTRKVTPELASLLRTLSFARVVIFSLVLSLALHAFANEKNNLCIEGLLPNERRQVTPTVKSELAKHSGTSLNKVARILRSKKSDDEKKVLIVNTIKSNIYFESTLPGFFITQIAEKWVKSDQRPTLGQIRADLEKEMTLRRNVHWQGMLDLNLEFRNDLEAKEDVLQRIQLVSRNSEYHLYSLGPVRSFKELFAVVAVLSNVWPRPFHFNPLLPARIMQLEVEELPGVYIYFFEGLTAMNMAFQRPSMQIERGLWPRRGYDVFGSVAGGHDLMGSDLLKYMELAQQEAKADWAALRDNNYRRKLLLEQEFLAKEVRPKVLSARQTDPVFLAVSSSHVAMRTLSHEIWHGVYFTKPEYAQWCRDYWASLSRQDRELFIEMAEGFGYKLAEDESHAANEFQAFMLEKDAVVAPNPLIVQKEAVVRQLRPAFLKAFAATPYAKLLD